MNGIIFLQIIFQDSKVLEKQTTLVPIGPDGKITKDKFEVSNEGYATIVVDSELNKFPAIWEVRQGTKRLATLLIPNQDTFKKVWMEPNSSMDLAKILVFNIDDKGVINLTIGKPKPQEVKPVNYVLPMVTEKWMKGKAVDKSGQALKNTTFIVYVQKKAETQHKDMKFMPLLSGTTDPMGTFHVKVSTALFESAYATLGNATTSPIPIILEDGRLPGFALLVVEDVSAVKDVDPEDDCACHAVPPARLPEMEDLLSQDSNYQQDIGGSCVNFTTPNRALEEFSYNMVVRLTDPEVMNAPGYLDNLNIRIKELETTLANALKEQSKGYDSKALVGDQNAKAPSPLLSELYLWKAELEAITNEAYPNSGFKESVKGRSTSIAFNLRFVTKPSSITPQFNELSTAGDVYLKMHFSTRASALAKLTSIIEAQISLDNKADKMGGGQSSGANTITPDYDRLSLNTDWMQMELTRLKAEQKAATERNNISTMRKKLSVQNQIQWDAPMPLVQPASIAHGHLLTFRQVWRADGYSMGDLLYSLPLAPGQQKQIVIHDWDRRETASRSETQSQLDSISNSLTQDRDINEIVKASLQEDIEGHSKAKTSGIGGGMGVGTSAGAEVPIGGVPVNLKVGFSGGFSASKGKSESWADQKSSRDMSANTMQKIREKTMQNASSLRSNRSTVITTMSQSESTNVTTESIANYNHCHAITIQYFEVLRHLAVHNELADAQECLFIPLSISLFDDAKVCRWNDLLRPALRAPGSKYDRLVKGFSSIRRYYDIQALGKSPEDVYYNVPAGRYCDEKITDLSGSLRLKIHFACPKKVLQNLDVSQAEIISKLNPVDGLFQRAMGNNGFQAINQFLVDQDADRQAWTEQLGFIREIEDIRYKVNRVSDEQREAIFQAEMTRVNAVAQFAKHLQISLASPTQTPIRVRIALTRSGDAKRAKMNGEATSYDFSFRSASNHMMLERDQIQALTVSSSWMYSLPDGSNLLLDHVAAQYENKFISAKLCNAYPADDLIAGGSTLQTPMSEAEMVSPRAEDLQLRHELLDHLNCNLEYYHKAIWGQMDEDRRLMLLEGFEIEVPPRENPAYVSGGTEPQFLFGNQTEVRSVASLVENRLIGIAGNSLIMPVAKGFNLNPIFRYADDEVEIEGRKISKLMSYYMPEKGFKETPFRISIPTKGVFAEAVMGACNSCEKIDNTRYWKWDEHPIPNTPTAIDSVSADSRRAEPSLLNPSAMSNALISQQNGREYALPTALNAAMELLKANSFTNITGLEGNQLGALEAMKANAEAAKEYAKIAADLAKSAEIPKNADAVVESIKKGVTDPKKQQELIERYFEDKVGGNKGKGKIIGGETDEDEAEVTESGIKQATQGLLDGVRNAAKGKAKIELPDGTKIETEHEGVANTMPVVEESWAESDDLLLGMMEPTPYESREDVVSDNGIVDPNDPSNTTV